MSQGELLVQLKTSYPSIAPEADTSGSAAEETTAPVWKEAIFLTLTSAEAAEVSWMGVLPEYLIRWVSPLAVVARRRIWSADGTRLVKAVFPTKTCGMRRLTQSGI